MPSRIEELIAAWRKFADTDYTKGMKLGDSRKKAQYELMMAGQSLAYATAAQNLERAYREEVVPLVKMFYRLKVEAAYAKQFVDNSLAAADLERAIEDSVAVLRRFDAPSGTEPKQ